MKKALVITSINPPTDAIKQFSLLKDWQVVVVGDKKTPKDWQLENVTYLGIDHKTNLRLPWNNYARKMIGYEYAIINGAELIAETDDDNFPLLNWNEPSSWNCNKIVIKNGFANIYKVFSMEEDIIWPRGLPLKDINAALTIVISKEANKVGIWQSLVNKDPDVDAIHRLIFNNEGVIFQNRDPVALSKGTICPFNSQNTFFRKELFHLLYLPITVNARFSDILRSFVAQPIMWKAGYKLGFTSANAEQIRNKHNLMNDFKDELPCYLYPEQVIKVVKKSIQDTDFIQDSLLKAYKGLVIAGIVKGKELEYLTNWIDIIDNATDFFNNEIKNDWVEIDENEEVNYGS